MNRWGKEMWLEKEEFVGCLNVILDSDSAAFLGEQLLISA
jgi:hypothetical protein